QAVADIVGRGVVRRAGNQRIVGLYLADGHVVVEAEIRQDDEIVDRDGRFGGGERGGHRALCGDDGGRIRLIGVDHHLRRGVVVIHLLRRGQIGQRARVVGSGRKGGRRHRRRGGWRRRRGRGQHAGI